MTPEAFAYWLQGYVELNGGKHPTEDQWSIIMEHLKTVFFKITPDRGGGGHGPISPIYPRVGKDTVPEWPWDTPPLYPPSGPNTAPWNRPLGDYPTSPVIVC